MKKTFDILNISPTQWVLVDKTRKPVSPEYFYSSTQKAIGWNAYKETKVYDGSWPILAAYPKIGDVLLPPSLLCEKPNIDKIAHEWAVDNDWGEDRFHWPELEKGFKAGYEAAGGYTKEHIQKAITYGMDLQIGLQEMPKRKFIESLSSPSPRALVIDVNEDGSMPADNGVIIYTEVIY